MIFNFISLIQHDVYKPDIFFEFFAQMNKRRRNGVWLVETQQYVICLPNLTCSVCRREWEDLQYYYNVAFGKIQL